MLLFLPELSRSCYFQGGLDSGGQDGFFFKWALWGRDTDEPQSAKKGWNKSLCLKHPSTSFFPSSTHVSRQSWHTAARCSFYICKMFQFINPSIVIILIHRSNFISISARTLLMGTGCKPRFVLSLKEKNENYLFPPGCWGTICLSKRSSSQVWLPDHEQKQQGKYGWGGHHWAHFPGGNIMTLS